MDEQVSHVQGSTTPLFVELFAGRGSLSRAALQAGFSVLSVDHEGHDPVVPIIQLDLTTESGEAILWDMLDSRQLLAVHLGLPCGTASLARERPISRALQLQGVPNPPPLRSAECPLGLPGLGEVHQAKVNSANKLYWLAIKIMVFCFERGIVFSIENPERSWLWAALVQLSLQHSKEAAELYNRLDKVTFHACCHGSTRRKSTSWLSTRGVYARLAATCQNDHPHEPWGVRWNNGTWIFDTASEAAYPVVLAQRAVACLVDVAIQRGYNLTKLTRLHDMSTAVQAKQTRKHKPLIPEFHHFSKKKAADPLPPNAKVVAPHLGGENREEQDSDVLQEGAQLEKVGFYHTPKQFVSRAMQTGHPMDTTDHVEQVTLEALRFNLKYSPQVIELERKKNLLQAKLLAKQNEGLEAELHSKLPAFMQKVLAGKRILVWKNLLEKYGYDDMAVVGFMTKGVPLVGRHDTPPCYPELIRPASLTQEDLENSACWRRKAILGKKGGKQDLAHAKHLEETAKEELDLGFVEGPFGSEQEVTEFLGHDRWMAVRRFVLVQGGAEAKLRPIDDCHESQLNQAFTSTSYLQLQDMDYISGLALRIAEAVKNGEQRFGSGEWYGKCLDLSKAYKQVGIDPRHRHLAVLFYYDSNGAQQFLVANSLMFGATAAVYAFNRLSRSLWFLMNRMLLIPCGVFYDDFPLFSPKELAQNADEAASSLLDILGWRHARTGPKGKPFEDQFQVLGCNLDLRGIKDGLLVTGNKPGRLERLLEHFARVKQAGRISLHEAQILHGLLRYACGFFAGRHLHQVCAEIMAMGSGAVRSRSKDLSSLCDYAVSTLKASRPRTLTAFSEKRPILIFTDGAWEQNRGGLGAVVIDMATGEKWVLAGLVPQQLLDRWSELVGDQLICQIELYAMVTLRWMFKERLNGRRSIWWVDNDAARFALIKGLSNSPTMLQLVRAFYAFELSFPTFSWVERVASDSNPADAPSRDNASEVMALLDVQHCLEFQHPEELLAQLGITAGQKRKGVNR